MPYTVSHIRVLHLSVILLNSSICAAKTGNIRWKRLSCQLVNYELDPLRVCGVTFDAYCTSVPSFLANSCASLYNFSYPLSVLIFTRFVFVAVIRSTVLTIDIPFS